MRRRSRASLRTTRDRFEVAYYVATKVPSVKRSGDVRFDVGDGDDSSSPALYVRRTLRILVTTLRGQLALGSRPASRRLVSAMPSLRIASSRSRTTAAVSRLAASNRFSSAASSHFRYSASDAKSARFLASAAGAVAAPDGDGASASSSAAENENGTRPESPSVWRLVRNRLLQPQSLPHLPAPPRGNHRAPTLQSHPPATRARVDQRTRTAPPPRLPPPDASPRRRAPRLPPPPRDAPGARLLCVAAAAPCDALISATSARASRARGTDELPPQTVPSRRSDRPEPRRRAACGPACCARLSPARGRRVPPTPAQNVQQKAKTRRGVALELLPVGMTANSALASSFEQREVRSRATRRFPERRRRAVTNARDSRVSGAPSPPACPATALRAAGAPDAAAGPAKSARRTGSAGAPAAVPGLKRQPPPPRGGDDGQLRCSARDVHARARDDETASS